LAASVALGASAAQAQPKTAAPTAVDAGSGERTPLLPVVELRALDVSDSNARRFEATLPAALGGSKLIANSGEIGYFGTGNVDGAGPLRAVDLVRGSEVWTVDGVIVANATASDTLVFAPIDATQNGWTKPGVLALDARSGRVVANLHGVFGGYVSNGTYYANRSDDGIHAFAAIDGRTAHEYWETRGTGGASGAPTQIGATLLQSFFESGAISVDAMYGIDVATGRQKWRTGWGQQPLGIGRRVVYLDDTWFPAQTENYIPLTVATVDPATGTKLHEYNYRPEPERNWSPGQISPNAERSSHVAGGYVYLRVNDKWYRYDADRAPADAHPARLDGVDDILAWLDANKLLVRAGGVIGVARSQPDRLEWRRLARGSLHSPLIARPDGVRYFVADGALLAIDSGGGHARRLGRVACDPVGEIVTWGAFVAVRCPPALSAHGGRIIGFVDRRQADSGVLPRPRATQAPKYVLRLHPRLAIAGSDRRPWQRPSVVISNGTFNAVAPGGLPKRVDSAAIPPYEEVQLVSSPAGVEFGSTTDVVLDRHGTVWFKTGPDPTLTSVDRSGAMRNVPLPEPSPTPVPGGGLRLNGNHPEIRLATGPDGEAWFSGSDPLRMIARVDGSVRYPIGADLGDVEILTGGNDGALWFVTATALGRIARNGSISHVPLPDLLKSREYYHLRLTADLSDGVWIASGRRIVHMGLRGVRQSFELPNVSSEVDSIALGCDGTLYVVDRIGVELARIGGDGVLAAFPVDLFSLDGITTSATCRQWFAGRSRFGKLIVGTFTFAAAPGRSARRQQ
jgi:hypothetical protein